MNRYFYYCGPLNLLPENICSIPVLIFEVDGKKRIAIDPISTCDNSIEHFVWGFEEDWLILNKLTGKINLTSLSSLMTEYEIVSRSEI